VFSFLGFMILSNFVAPASCRLSRFRGGLIGIGQGGDQARIPRFARDDSQEGKQKAGPL